MQVLSTDASIDNTAVVSVDHARELIQSCEKLRTRREKANRKRFGRLLKDPKAIEVTITLTDEVMRINSMREALTIFNHAARKASVQGFGPLNAFGLKFIRILAIGLPGVVIRLVHQRVRALSKDLILPAEQNRLSKHLGKRKEEGIRLNINVLGEAVLGKSLL